MLHWNLESSYLSLPSRFYSFVGTDPVPSAEWAVFNASLADSMGMGSVAGREDLAILSGNRPPPRARVLAQAYAGHQFGHFTMLGDGRAAVLGELVDPRGLRWDLQLKGSGPTPYARGGDGKAVLGPMLREYLVGEYLHAVGISATRALSVATTGESIRREGVKPGAVLCRVSSSHLRVGTFEYAAALADAEALAALADYAIARHYPRARDAENPYLAFLDAVGSAQADLVARWMCVGFVHGVMNTDNVSIGGQAMDFGPCAFLDAYGGGQVFSSIDIAGRYAWGRQAEIATWNHARLAESLLPLLDSNPDRAVTLAEESIERFDAAVAENLNSGFSRKLGLVRRRDGDLVLVRGLLSWMDAEKADFTTTFLALARKAAGTDPAFPLPEEPWLDRWLERIHDEAGAADLMAASNPRVHPRNRPVQAALDAAETGDLRPFHRLARALADPWAPEAALEELDPGEGSGQRPFITYCGT